MAPQIRLRRADGTWVVRAGGAVIGESRAAIELSEGDLAPVIYFPRDDIAMALLDDSAHTSTCPHKGTARYFSIQTKSETLQDTVWSYESPLAGLERIAGHVAFSTGEKVAVEQL